MERILEYILFIYVFVFPFYYTRSDVVAYSCSGSSQAIEYILCIHHSLYIFYISLLYIIYTDVLLDINVVCWWNGNSFYLHLLCFL